MTFRIRFRPQPRFEQVSERLAALAGHTPAEHYADASVWLRVAIPEDRQLQADVLCGAAGGEEPVVVRWRSADGGIRYVEQQTAPLPDERGAVAGLVGIVRDLTEARRAEAELKEVTQRLSAHIDNSPLGVVEFDRQYRIMRWSKESERMFGWKAEEVLGRSISELKWVYEDDLEAVESESAQLMSGALARSVNVNRNYAKDGRVVYCEWYNSAIHDDEGRLRSVLSLVLDVTDRKQAEEALKKSEYWLRESQRASRIGTYRLDVRTGTWVSSETLDEIFGIGGEFRRDVEGWKELVHPEQREEMASYFFEQVIGRGQPFDREYRIQRKSDGEVRWVLGRGALLRDEAGSIVHVTGTIQDVTERRQMEEDLRQALKMESIGRLAGGLAHDFNNLLTVINGYSELLLQQIGKETPTHGEVEQILRAGERAATLTRQLLAFSRKQIIEPKVLDLNLLMADLGKMLVRLIGENIDLKMVHGKNLGPVKVDPGQFEQVLVNLSVNARDAMPDGGTLLIETANVDLDEEYCAQRPYHIQPGRFVRLAVSDTGRGMTGETSKRIFEPFFTTRPRDRERVSACR